MRKLAKKTEKLDLTNQPTTKSIKKNQLLSTNNLEIKQFRKDWDERQSLVWLGKKYNLRPEKIKKLAKQLGFLERSKKYKFNCYERFLLKEDNIEQFSNLYLNISIPVQKIKERYGFPDSSYVVRTAKLLDLPIRKRPARKFSNNKDEFINLWNQGISISQISKKLNVTEITLSHWKKKLNLANRTSDFQQKNRKLKFAVDLSSILKQSMGAKFLYDICEEMNIAEINIHDICNSFPLFDFLVLDLDVTTQSKWKNSDFFGICSGQTIVFFRNLEESLIYNLANIILNKSRLSTKYTKEQNEYFVKLLFTNHKHLEKFQTELYHLIKQKNLRTIFQSKIDEKIQSFSISCNDDVYPINKLSYVSKKIIQNSKMKKFFGCVFSKNFFLSNLNKLFQHDQLHMLTRMFCAMNFRVVQSDSTSFFDLKIESETETYYVKLMVYGTISDTDLLIFSTNLRNSQGIVITFQNYEQSLEIKFSNNITIFTKEDIKELLNSIVYLPSSENSICKIMYGDYKGEFVFIDKLEFDTNQAQVTSFLNCTNLICDVGSLKEIFLTTRKNNRKEAIDLFYKLRKVTNHESFFALGDFDHISLVQARKKYRYGHKIQGIVSKNTVHIQIPEVGHDKSQSGLTGLDQCRLSLYCDCFDWLDQSKKFHMCKHLVSFFFYLWSQLFPDVEQISKFNKKINHNVTKCFISFFLDEIYFFIRTRPVIEQFWIDNVENLSDVRTETRKIAHLIIKVLIENFQSENYEKTIKKSLSKITNTVSGKRQTNSVHMIHIIYKNLTQQIKINDMLNYSIKNLTETQKYEIILTLETFFDELVTVQNTNPSKKYSDSRSFL